MEAGDKWARLEETVRRILREELERQAEAITSTIAKAGTTKTKIEFVNGSFIGISQLHRDTWKAAYPSVNIEEEISKAAAYLTSNPHKAPRSRVARFLNAWLCRTQDRAAIQSIPARREEIKRRVCAYCQLDAIGTVNAINHCRAHYQDAYEERPRRMLGVVPKPVAGAD